MNLSNDKRICVLQDNKAVAEFAVNTWRDIAQQSVAEKGVFTAALSGGRTPVAFYQKLTAGPHSELWDRTHIFFADERFVPSDDRDSNYRLINEHLFSRITIPKENIHPILTQGFTIEVSAEKYAADIRSFFKIGYTDIPVFDLILLGIGKDGHTASLFPGTSSLQEAKHLAIPVIADASPTERVSLTLEVLNSAKNIVFLVTGESKAAVIKEVIEDNKTMLPAAQVRPVHGMVLFLMDEDAASRLSSKGG